jgi:sugar phosphate isomerase/epimerase
LVDALHVARSHTTLDDLRALPPALLHYAQICDAPAGKDFTVEQMVHTARCERLLPGEGGIDPARIFAALPADVPVSVEVPHQVRAAQVGDVAWARQALAASRRLLEAV